MGIQLMVSLLRLFNLREDNSAIPVATSHDLPTFVENQNRLVKLLDASINLLKAIIEAD